MFDTSNGEKPCPSTRSGIQLGRYAAPWVANLDRLRKLSFSTSDGTSALTRINIALRRQLGSFVGVGVAATALHYAVLFGLVRLAVLPPVPAALCGFVVGGVLSYGLNRRHTFGSERPHEEAVWRFALVAGVAFALTYAFMRVMVERWRLPYLPAQGVTSGVVMVWTFAANKLWTFRGEM